MHIYKHCLSYVYILSCCHLAMAAPVTFRTETFQLQFASDGKPVSFKTAAGESQRLNVARPGHGFAIEDAAGHQMFLTDLSLRGDRLVAVSENGTQEVVFHVRQAARYLAFKIERLKGVPRNSGLLLGFELNADSRVRVLETDYMTTVENGPDRVAVSWEYLWNRHESNPLGGFAIYYAEDEEAEDEIILSIWADEGLPHPKVQGKWTYERAKAWVRRWQEMFADQSQFILEADTLRDLYEGVAYAEMAGARQVYLFTNTWRGGFWPTDQGHWQLKKNVFPHGEADLRAYSDYLRTKDIYLKLHYLSGSLGFRDPIYVSDRPDRRLAQWGAGTLGAEAGELSPTMRFRPDPGVELPAKIGRGFRIIPPLLNHVHGFHHMRIEDEIVLVGSYEDTDSGVWKLVNCKRGMYGTKAAAHPAGAPMVGLIDTYGQNFLPGSDSTLLEEIATGYAEFCNRCGVYNVEFDGFENNAYHGRWASEKFASLIYRRLDHPCTSGGSSGRPPKCWMEYRLNSTKRLMEGFRFNVHSSHRAPLFLDSPSREATKLLDAHYELSQGAARGAPAFGMSKPEPMFGLTVQELKTHGLAREMAEIVKNWKIASRSMTEQQRAAIRDSFSTVPRRLPDASRDKASALVHRLDKLDDGRFQIVPVKILTRQGEDMGWQSWQEHGPIEPRQLMKPGERRRLENPFDAQPAKFVIRVLWATDHASTDNMNLQPDLSQIGNRGDTEVGEEGESLTMSFSNARSAPRWEVEKLPQWRHEPIDMSRHRAVGMYVTGDASHAILAFQIPGRDYVVPIDFDGERYIEIPNGEASWTSGHWGWRVGTHRSNYDKVGRFKIGFGHVPPETTANIKVRGLKALREIDTKLVDPVIHVAGGWLRVAGSVASGNYLEYSGGDKATVYDKNWNRLKQLSVSRHNYQMPKGLSEISITASGRKALPWLAVQIMTEGKPIPIASD